jgi:hypothetical protein
VVAAHHNQPSKGVLDKVSEPTNENTSTKSFPQCLYEVLLSLDVGYAVTLSEWTFIHRGDPHRFSIYFMLPVERLFSRTADDINRSMHLAATSGTGHEIASIIFTFVIATSVLILLRLIAPTRLSHTILDPVGGIAVLALVPALWLHAYQASMFPNPGSLAFWASFHWSLFDIEVPLVCAGMLYGRKGRLPLWACVLILTVHYSWWLGWMRSDLYWAPRWWASPLWVPAVFFVVFPASGFAWLYYARQSAESSEVTHETHPLLT